MDNLNGPCFWASISPSVKWGWRNPACPVLGMLSRQRGCGAVGRVQTVILEHRGLGWVPCCSILTACLVQVSWEMDGLDEKNFKGLGQALGVPGPAGGTQWVTNKICLNLFERWPTWLTLWGNGRCEPATVVGEICSSVKFVHSFVHLSTDFHWHLMCVLQDWSHNCRARGKNENMGPLVQKWRISRQPQQNVKPNTEPF